MPELGTSLGIASIASTALWWMGKIAYKLVESKTAAGTGKQASGELDPAVWKQEFRTALDEKIDQRLLPIFENLAKSQENQSRTLEAQQHLLENLGRVLEGMAELLKQQRRR